MSAGWVRPTVEAVKAIHAEVLAAHGGRGGLRDEALVASAVAAPQATMMGKPLISDPIEIAAAYLFYLCWIVAHQWWRPCATPCKSVSVCVNPWREFRNLMPVMMSHRFTRIKHGCAYYLGPLALFRISCSWFSRKAAHSAPGIQRTSPLTNATSRPPSRVRLPK